MHHTHTAKDVERVVSDYLAVSRGRKLYASDAEHLLAEGRSWALLVEALRGAGEMPDDGMPQEITIAGTHR